MKRFTILLAVLLVAASCGTSLTRERRTEVSYADYTAYPDMWISPNPCAMPHKALGDLLIEVHPAIMHTNEKNQSGNYSSNYGVWTFERIDGSELLEMAVVEARARSANGISNLEITAQRSESGAPTLYRISGLLIRIE